MAFSAKANDYDYTIHGADGIVGVKNEVKYPISQEDWDRQNPHREHRDSECKECNFVQDKDVLFIYIVTRELKDKATKKPLFFGKFTMPGWVGHSGFYLFRCELCDQVSIDYPHGYTRYGLMFLRCDNCQGILPLEVTEEKTVYEKECVHIPKPTIEERISELNEVIATANTRGVKVIVASSGNEKNPKIGFFEFLREYFRF